jgi:hypothetical protein
MLALLLTAAALAQTFIVDAAEPVSLRVAGTWTRALHTDDGWKLAFGTADTFWLSDLEQATADDPTSWVLTGDRTDLQDRSGTKDHAISRCPDGTWLHVASANVTEPNDSAYAWRHAADFSLLASVTLEEGATERMHNDMVIFCSRLGTGAVFPASGLGGGIGNTVFPLDDDLSIGGLFSIDELPRAEGGAILTDATEDLRYQTGGDQLGQGLVVRTYDADWTSLSLTELDLIDPPLRAFWPQRLMQLGDYFLLAFVARDDRAGNGDLGNIYVAVLDRDWTMLERTKVTSEADNAGISMRPWMERHGRQLLVSFDAETQHTIAELTIDPVAFGLSEDDLYADTAWTPDDDDTASDDTITTTDDSGCGRRSRRGASFIGLGTLLLLGLGRRRR